ncbi:ubiquinone biosynthesis O-methyltransferase, mitochondrial-like, partial [Temnothorax curvispinosus]|uniref:Ubiquinone biosynthesis O-methyltransferase, mitochondrial-like n=1 Tax=Temnothorax curvispinosus TaxID=300111 RepID=A0A6J1PFS4_9HYME
FLKECVKIVKPGKSIFITTINKTLTSLLSTIVAAEYIFGSAPRGNHQWNKFIAPHKVQRILENYGCETKLIRGMHFNPATRQWSRSSTASTFYGLHAIKHKGTGILSGNIVCVNKTRPMSTIDSKAVEYHSAMKNIWWDENGPINA